MCKWRAVSRRVTVGRDSRGSPAPPARCVARWGGTTGAPWGSSPLGPRATCRVRTTPPARRLSKNNTEICYARATEIRTTRIFCQYRCYAQFCEQSADRLCNWNFWTADYFSRLVLGLYVYLWSCRHCSQLFHTARGRGSIYVTGTFVGRILIHNE